MKTFDQDPLTEELRSCLEEHNKVFEQLLPTTEHQLPLQEAGANANLVFSDIKDNLVLSDITSAISDFRPPSLFEESMVENIIPDYSFTSPFFEEIGRGITNIVQAWNQSALKQIVEDTIKATQSFSSALSAHATSPLLKWLHEVDISPLLCILGKLNLDGKQIQRCEEYTKAYLLAMYNCKWFPYAASAMDYKLVTQIAEILETSRGASKRRERRIDRLVLDYYSSATINRIKKSWRKTNIEPHIKKILIQAISAHVRGEYALCISALAPLWEGLIYIKAHDATMQTRERQKMALMQKDLAALTEANDYDEIISDYFENFIVSPCNSVGDIVDGVPNRHGFSHSWHRSYPNKKASLNAILLTDYIIHLNPLKG